MVNWIKSKKLHIIFWAALIFFIFSANSLYTNYFLQNGKPYQPALPLPAESQKIQYQLGNLASIRVGGEDLYELRGFAFVQSNPMLKNKISVVLHSPSQTLVFATRPITVPGMIKSYKGYKPGMDQAEFSLFLSQAVFKPGIYTIGLLLENQAGSGRTFTITGSRIKITPNTILYNPFTTNFPQK